MFLPEVYLLLAIKQFRTRNNAFTIPHHWQDQKLSCILMRNTMWIKSSYFIAVFFLLLIMLLMISKDSSSNSRNWDFFSLTCYSRSFAVLHCTCRSLLHFDLTSLKSIRLISSSSCWYGCPSVLELFLIGLSKPSLNWFCSFQGKPTQYHSNASLPQPLMLKKVKLKSSMKTYKTFYN